MPHVDDDLAIRGKLDMATVHGSGSWTFEVNPLAVVTAAMTRAFEFVLGRLPIGRTTQMRAARVNDEKAIRCAVHPNPVLLEPLLVDT